MAEPENKNGLTPADGRETSSPPVTPDSFVTALRNADAYELYGAGEGFDAAPLNELEHGAPLLNFLRQWSAYQSQEYLARSAQSRAHSPEEIAVANGVIEYARQAQARVTKKIKELLPADIRERVLTMKDRQWYASGSVMGNYEFALQHGLPPLLTRERNPLFNELPEEFQIRDELAAALKNLKIWKGNRDDTEEYVVRLQDRKGIGFLPQVLAAVPTMTDLAQDDLLEIADEQLKNEVFRVVQAYLKLSEHQGNHKDLNRKK